MLGRYISTLSPCVFTCSTDCEFQTVPQSLTEKDYWSEVNSHIQKVKGARDGVVVVGGGQYSTITHS